jgi:26S proteasome regulatory subunit N10
MSMEEEQARQAAAAQTTSSSASTSAPTLPTAEPVSEPADPTDDEEEAMLKQALALSEGHDVDMVANDDEDEDMSEEEAIARAIEMSMKEPQGADEKDKK